MSKSKMSRTEKRERRLNHSSLIKSINDNSNYSIPRWMFVTTTVFNRDDFTCIECGSHKNLVCHNKMIVDKIPLWGYDLCNYETLCEGCCSGAHQMVVSKEYYEGYINFHKQGLVDFRKMNNVKKIPVSNSNKEDKGLTLKDKFAIV